MPATQLDGTGIRRLAFQERAARQVASRHARHLEETAARAGEERERAPFFQAFAAITLSGKTLVLGDAVSLIQEPMAVKPVVLWLSRGRVLAQTTFNSFQPGGRYHALLAGGVPVTPLAELAAAGAPGVELAGDPATTAVWFGTIGTFVADEAPGAGFSVAGSDVDALDPETLAALRERRLADGRRRPLILVYDEAHELSAAHAALLLSLEPDVVLLASATMKMPQALVAVATRLKEAGWRDDELTTIPRLAT